MWRTTIAVGVLGCILLTVMIGGCRLHATNRDLALAHFQELELRTAEEFAALIDSHLTGAARSLRAIALSLGAAPGADVLGDFLAHQDGCANLPCFTALSQIDAAGATRHAAGAPLDATPAQIQHAASWGAEEANRRRLSLILSPSHESSLVLVTPSSQHGAVAAQIRLDELFSGRTQMSAAAWPTFATVVLKSDGTVVFHSQRPDMRMNNVYRRTSRCSECHASLDHVERMLAMEHGVVRYRVRGVEQIAAVAPLTFESERWIVVVKVPAEQVLALRSAEMRQLTALMTAVVLLVGTAAVITWRDGRRRIRAEAEALAEAHEKAWLEDSHNELTTLNAKLERAAHEWRTTVDTIDAGLIVLEPAGVILRMNLAAAATLPDALPSWLGRPTSRLADHEPWSAALAHAADAIGRQTVTTDRVRDRSNRTWDLWIRAVPNDQRAAVLILARDVTDVVELQESVRRSETMAQLGAIVSGVAHEVRNPLFAISSLVDAWAVQSHRDPTPFVDALRSEVGRLRTLMVDLLEYGRPAKPTRHAQLLRGVVQGAVRECSHEATARRVRVAVAEGADGTVLMDPRRLERVFINIVQNAVQHAPEDSTVRLETTASADGLQIAVTVRDSGPGFAPDDLPRIFSPFFSRRPGGFGLGLAITERIVNEHQGRIMAANDPTGGAVVTVWLPLYPARADVRAQEVAC